jgi:hypothetical protein
MGYTHYWTVSKSEIDGKTWKKISDDIKVIIKNSPATLVREYDNINQPPLIDGKVVVFNGVGDNGHETFFISRVNDPLCSFCKTAQKPYDVAVTAILAYLDSVWPNLYSVASDGEPDEWQAGVSLAKVALPAQAHAISVPRQVKAYA